MALEPAAFPLLYNTLASALPGHFRRRRGKLSPARVLGMLCVMCTLGQKGYRRVIQEMRAGLSQSFGWESAGEIPTAEALCLARPQLTKDLCERGFAAVRDVCTTVARKPVMSYGSWRIVAIDGTRLALPIAPKLSAHFGRPSNGRGTAEAPMAGLVQLWDVGANRPVAFALTTCSFDERDEALDLFQHLGPNDLLVGDRGYPSHALFCALAERRCGFLLRCSSKANAEVITFLKGQADDAVVELRLRNHHGVVRSGAPVLAVRLLRMQLPNGVTEVLATNLRAEDGHHPQQLFALYQHRWRIETAFREMKVWHALQTFSATYPEGIHQEVTAIQIFMLLAAELEARARLFHDQMTTSGADLASPSGATALEVADTGIRFNRLLIADAVVQILRYAHAPGSIHELVERLLQNIWRERSKYRPGRSSPRRRKSAARGFAGR